MLFEHALLRCNKRISSGDKNVPDALQGTSNYELLLKESPQQGWSVASSGTHDRARHDYNTRVQVASVSM